MSLMELSGAIVSPDEVVENVAGNEGGLWAKASDWAATYGDDLKFQFIVQDCAWFEKAKYGVDDEFEYVVSAEIVNKAEDMFLIDIKARNRQKICKSLGLESPTASEFLIALKGQTVEVTVEHFKQFNSYGFVIDIAREASTEMKPKTKTVQKRNPRRA